MPLKTLAWLLVPLLGLLELGGHFYFANRAPEPEEWRVVRETLKELRQHDELVVITPDWADPNARYAFGDELMPVEQRARADVSRFQRAIEVSIIGSRAEELSGWKLESERRQGAFSFRTLENPSPARVRFDFVDSLPKARVSDDKNGTSKPCRWSPHARRSAGGLHGHPAYPGERFDCPGPDFHFAGVTVVEDEHWRPRRCIWAHPVADKTFVIAYDDVLLGEKIYGYATLPWWLEREEHGAPVNLDVTIDGQAIGRYVHRDGQGWKHFEFSTGQSRGKTGRVEFRVSSVSARDRQFCFAADSR